jgi:hypothetical protein
VHLVLLTIALVNLFTKSLATKFGIVFAGTLFCLFYVSEKMNIRKFKDTERQMREHFQLMHEERVGQDTVDVRPGNILVTVRDYNTLVHLQYVLQHSDTAEQDVVVMEARLTGFASAEYDISTDQIFSDYEQTLFTRAVAIAEKEGKHISLLVVPARDVWSAIVQTANSLESAVVVAGLSSKMTADEQAFKLGQAWEAMPPPKRQFVFQVVRPDAQVSTFRIGPHTPTMKPEDVNLVHKMWLDLKRQHDTDELHHSDILTLALTRLARDYGRDKEEVLNALRKGASRRGKSMMPALPYLAEPDPPESVKRHEKDKKKPPEPPVLGPF